MSDEHRVSDVSGEERDSASTPSRRELRGRGRRHRGGLIGFLRESAIVIATALALSFIIKSFLFQAFYIPSVSMERTLMVNDRVLVSLLEPGPFALKRGDIVVFRDPGGWLQQSPPPARSALGQGVVDVLTFVGVLPQDSDEHLIKRVIGMPGDHVQCCSADGKLKINGVEITETYLSGGVAPSVTDFDVVVPADSVWLMGDNRPESLDSRYHPDLNKGALKENYIVGRAVLLFWPFDRFTTLSNHGEVFARVPAP